MKRCPKCYQIYGNTETFCEADGQRLLPDPGLTLETTELVPDGPPAKNLSALGTGLIGLITGVARLIVFYHGDTISLFPADDIRACSRVRRYANHSKVTVKDTSANPR